MENPFLVDGLKLLAVIALVLTNGFFVAAEFSLVSVRRTRIAELVAKGDVSAARVKKAIDNPDAVIAATQLGITIASLGLGWIGEPALAHLLQPIVELFPIDIQSGVSHSLSAAIAFSMITFLHVVIGELAPKSIALQYPEDTSLLVARPTLWAEWIFKPAIWLLNGAGNAFLRLVGIKPVSGHELLHSVEELKMLVTASTEGGVVEEEESEMLHAIFDLGELVDRQVMIPRMEVVGVEADMPLDEIIALATQSTFTKFSVLPSPLTPIRRRDLRHLAAARTLVPSKAPTKVPPTVGRSALGRQRKGPPKDLGSKSGPTTAAAGTARARRGSRTPCTRPTPRACSG